MTTISPPVTFTSAPQEAGREAELPGIADLSKLLSDPSRLRALARDALLLTNVRDSVIVTDLEGVVTFWNEGATRLFGFSADEMVGRPYAERLPEPSRSEVSDWIKRIAAGGAEFDGELLDYRRDGSRVWI